MKEVKGFCESLKCVEVLQWYDGPLVETRKDKAGNLYLFWWSNIVKDSTEYMVVPITKEILKKLIAQKITCREVLVGNPDGDAYKIYFYKNKIKSFSCKRKDFSENSLPEKGVYLFP